MNAFIVFASLFACAMAGAIGGYDSVDHMVHPTNYGHGLAASSRYDVRAQTIGKAVVAAPGLAYGGIAAPALGLGYGGIAAPALGLGYGGVVARPALAAAPLGLGYGGIVARPALAAAPLGLGYGGIVAAPQTVSSYGYSAVHPARAVAVGAVPALGAYGAYGAYHG